MHIDEAEYKLYRAVAQFHMALPQVMKNYLVYQEYRPTHGVVEFTIYTLYPYRMRIDLDFKLDDDLQPKEAVAKINEAYKDAIQWNEEHLGPLKKYTPDH